MQSMDQDCLTETVKKSKVLSGFRSNDREGFLGNQTSVFPCILVHCTVFLCTSVNLRKLVILIPVAAASTVHIGVAALVYCEHLLCLACIAIDFYVQASVLSQMLSVYKHQLKRKLPYL